MAGRNAVTIAAVITRPDSSSDVERHSLRASPRPNPSSNRPIRVRTNEDARLHDVSDESMPVNNINNRNNSSKQHQKMNDVRSDVEIKAYDIHGRGMHDGLRSDGVVKINVSGRVFEVATRHIRRYPNSLLASPVELLQFYEPALGMFFFDRNRHCFEYIAQYYQGDGYMKFPAELPDHLLEQELDFWKIGYCNLFKGSLTPINNTATFRSKCSAFFNDPNYSIWAKMWMCLDIFFILLSIALFVIKPEKVIEEAEKNLKWVRDIFLMINIACAIFFTTDLAARFIFSENHLRFFLHIMPCLDVIAILPLYIDIFEDYITMDGDIINVLKLFRMARVARCLKLIRRSKRLLLIFQILFECKEELSIMLMVWLTGTVISGSIMFFVEARLGDNKEFFSILESCWWAVTTIGTVGYGNIVPISPLGQVISTIIIFCSMIFMTVPMTIIIRRFSDSYEKVETNKKAIRVFGTDVRCHVLRSRAPSENTVNTNAWKWKSLTDRVQNMLRNEGPLYIPRGVL